ncbi:MAG: hypothetical protein Q7T11_07515 [Deltaproteobacteria bacterium]|nr:hypothetical protein [Deltaproteobacteria bacterium]
MKKIQILLLLVLSLFLGKNPLAQTIQRNIDSPAQAQLDSAHLEESEEEDGQYSRGPQEVACGCPLATYVSCEFDDDQPEGYSRIFLDLEVRGTSCAENINFNFADPGWHPEDHGVVCERNNQLNISIYSLCSFPSGNDRELALPVRIHVFAGGGNDRIDLSGIPSMRWGIQLEDPDGNFYSVNPIDEIEIRGGSGNDNNTGSL